jgi:hypothetical protein
MRNALQSAVEGGESRAQRTIRRARAFARRGGLLLVALVLLLAAVLAARGGVPFVREYFYVLAWYPALLALDALLLRRTGRSLLLDRPLALLSLAGWSLPFWLAFELLNLRLANWYYVDVPRDPLAGRLFMIASFATVLPGIAYTYLVLDTVRWPAFLTRLRTPQFVARRVVRRTMAGLGVLFLALPMIWPSVAFWMVWGVVPLLLEPLNRRPRWHSLLRDLEFGHPRRIVLLALAGALTGLYWEAMNVLALAKWIYTVPGFDTDSAVEMPPLGFLGFVPFAWSAYSFLRALEIRGLAVPFEPDAERAPILRVVAPHLRVFAIPCLVSFASFAIVPLMERNTVDSRLGRVEDLATASRRERAILALKGVASLDDVAARGGTPQGRSELAALLASTPARVERIASEARMATFRGIGIANAALLREVGVSSIDSLAQREPDELFAALAALGDDASRVKAPRVRHWVLAARRASPAAGSGRESR